MTTTGAGQSAWPIRLGDTAGEGFIFRARVADDADSAVLAAGEDDLEELLAYVAAEASHEKDRRARSGSTKPLRR